MNSKKGFMKKVATLMLVFALTLATLVSPLAVKTSTVSAAKKTIVVYDMNKDKKVKKVKANGQSFKGVQCLYAKYKYNWGYIWFLNTVVFFSDSNTDGNKGKTIDYRNKTIKVTGQYMQTGADAVKEVCAAFNATTPKSYPIVHQDNTVKPNKWMKVNFTCKLAANAQNTDKNSANGKNWPIMFYYAWKTANNDFSTGDDFYFRNMKITVQK